MIKVENISKSFASLKAVDDVSFTVETGENFILLGTSGCGKTTTLKMLNHLIKSDSGQILIEGKDISTKNPEELRRSIGYVLQGNGLFPHYTVAQNIAIVPDLLGWEAKRTAQRTQDLLEKLHLDKKYLNAYPDELSGGQQQRVGLARALAVDPPILFMDEPFGALDTVTRSKIRAEFSDLDELKRKTIVMVTHDVQEAFELGDRICLMDAGKIVQQGSPSDLLFNPANSFVSSFLNEQRLLLKFKALKLDQIAPLVAEGAFFSLNNEPVSNDADLWWVLEQMNFGNAGHLLIKDQQQNVIRSLSFNDLMEAFYNYKK